MINSRAFLDERLARPEQLPSAESLAELPSYLDAFLSHLRLLVGVPFTYLVPDERLLPESSIRFFYLDRSWTDRLVDGAAAVGKLGSREVAHYQAHAQDLSRVLDGRESLVREAQRRKLSAWPEPDPNGAEAGTITGFLLRSGLVSGWQHMEVRASAKGTPLRLARLERLSKGVMIALFFGVPDRVEIEEPHHGVQFGLSPGATGWMVHLRNNVGERIDHAAVGVPLRSGNKGVVHVRALRAALHKKQLEFAAEAPAQSGSAALALTVLDPPFLQPFAEGAEGGPRPVVIQALDPKELAAALAWVGNGQR